MSQETTQQSPALTASQNSWRCVNTHDKEGWLALMADEVVIEDPIGRRSPIRTATVCAARRSGRSSIRRSAPAK